MRRLYYLLSLCLLFPALVWAQIHIKVTSIPPTTPANSGIYIVGSFNNWAPGDPNYKLTAGSDGVLSVTINPAPGTVEYKFTRGNWDSVEGNSNGGYLPNRTYQYAGGEQTLSLTIASWEDIGGGNHSYASNVSIVSQDFYMPQLDRNRRIWLYLPPDYQTTGKRYPVLYMHDGQNIFDIATSFSGEWEVDESLNDLFNNGDPGIIVVAIDNGGAERINELTPWSNPQYGGGQASAYVDFIVETLKPYIDAHYRTRPERDYTGIMGSSLGGLTSMYAAIEHQDVFSKAGVFSPSFWFSSQAYTHVTQTGKQADMRIYMIAGQNESATMASDLNNMYNTLLGAGFRQDEIKKVIHPDGAHTEWYWAREFPAAYRWLFADAGPTNTTDTGVPVFTISPNPADSVLYLESTTTLSDPRLLVYTMDGRAVKPPTYLSGQSWDASILRSGVYIFRVYDGNKLIGSQQVVIGH